MLKNVKFGDKVVAFPYGIGTVVRIENDCVFNIQVEFKNPGGKTYTDTFSDEGKNIHWDNVIYCWTIKNAPSWIWDYFDKPKIKRSFEKWARVDEFGDVVILFDTEEEMRSRVLLPSVNHFNAKITGEIEYEVED